MSVKPEQAQSTMAINEVPAAVAGRCRLTSRHVRILAARGIEPQATWLADGTADTDDRHADWIEAHPDLTLVDGQAFESLSSWRQPTPAPASEVRTQLIDNLAGRIATIRPTRVRVVVDGYTASGKTSLAHELAAAVRARGRSTMRATLDDFKHPWKDAREQGYDRVTGEGYYRNAPDFDAARNLLLEPAGPEGSGRVALCGHDPLTGEDHRGATIDAPIDAVLIVDSVFGMRPEYDEYWDLRIWIDIPAELAIARGVERDTAMEGPAEAGRLHRDRYHVAEQIYVNEVDPKAKADVIIDNTDFANPVVVRW
jgi:uridine kinase